MQGALVNIGSRQCLDSLGRAAPASMGVAQCGGSGQLVRLNTAGQLGLGERCVEADRSGAKLVCYK